LCTIDHTALPSLQFILACCWGPVEPSLEVNMHKTGARVVQQDPKSLTN